MFRNRVLEFFNEAIILLCCYHTFCFTDFVDDPIIRYNVGFSLIVLTSINVGVNIIVMMLETLKKLFRIFKVLRQKYEKWKILRKIKQIQKKKEPITDWRAWYMNQEALDEQRKKIAKDFELYYELFPEERKLDQLKAK
jgi:hypothetical protein